MKDKHMINESSLDDNPSEEESETKKYHAQEIEGAADHLMNAEKVKDNKHLHSLALKHLESKNKHIQKITSLDHLKEVAKKKIKEDSGGY